MSLADLQATLQVAASISFVFNSADCNKDVSGSWAPGNAASFFGLWTGSWCGFRIAAKFAASTISISITFDHVAVVKVIPGAWYSSGLLQQALATKASPPWSNPAGWNTYFGADGSLNYAIGAVVAVDGISLTLTTDVDFTEEEQDVIQSQAAMGYWPLYCPQSTAAVKTGVVFEPGKTTITITTPSGISVLLGYNVFKVNQYLGAG